MQTYPQKKRKENETSIIKLNCLGEHVMNSSLSLSRGERRIIKPVLMHRSEISYMTRFGEKAKKHTEKNGEKFAGCNIERQEKKDSLYEEEVKFTWD